MLVARVVTALKMMIHFEIDSDIAAHRRHQAQKRLISAVSFWSLMRIIFQKRLQSSVIFKA